MVEESLSLAASIRAIDTALVINEILSNLECGKYWAIIKYGLLQVNFTVDEVETETIYLNGGDSKVPVALTLVSSERIVLIQSDATSCCYLLKTTMNSGGLVNAIQDILNTQLYSLVVLDTVLTFKCTS